MRSIHNSVVYQIYPVSFKDSNHDGIGDLQGIISKLDYLETLGVDMLWLTPIFPSPLYDNGYDVADYCKISERFGTMDDFKELVHKAKEKHIGIMLDMVFNHTSTDHTWFQKALNKEKKYMDYYIFTKEKVNWESKFGGNAFEYVDDLGMYYLHLFDKHQADLNWDNPEVRQELYKIVRFWLDIGVDGFRFDVVNLISKPKTFEDDFEGDGRRFYTDGPNIHSYLQELNQESFGQNPNLMTVGEMSSTSIENCINYSHKSGKELSMVFNFHHLKVDYPNNQKWALGKLDFFALKKLFNDWQTQMQEGGGWQALFWCNHDQPRIVSRFGNEHQYHKESAKMLATVIHLQRGTPYIYQGEEIGMTNAHFDTMDKYRDIESLNHYQILKDRGLSHDEVMQIIMERSRDNSRTPVQWDDQDFAGFSDVQPWIDVIDNYKTINVQQSMEDPNSIFAYYQKLIMLRKKHEVIQTGWYSPLLQDHPRVYAFLRELENKAIYVYANFFEEDVSIEIDATLHVLLSNYSTSTLSPSYTLRPYEVLVLSKNL